jgi:hypothetical protein
MPKKIDRGVGNPPPSVTIFDLETMVVKVDGGSLDLCPWCRSTSALASLNTTDLTGDQSSPSLQRTHLYCRAFPRSTPASRWPCQSVSLLHTQTTIGTTRVCTHICVTGQAWNVCNESASSMTDIVAIVLSGHVASLS